MKPRNIPEVPTHLDNGPQHRALLVAMREQIHQLTGRLAIPQPPTNVVATAQAFQNLIQWTKSTDADYYEVMSSATPNQQDHSSVIVDVGDSAQYQDRIGNNVTRYYWIRARKLTGATSNWSSMVTATALGSAAGVTPPTPPPPGNIIVQDQVTGRQIAYQLVGVRTQGQN